MRTTLSILVSTGFAASTVAAGYFGLDMLEAGFATPGNKGVMLCGLAGLYVLGAILNAVAFYRSLPN